MGVYKQKNSRYYWISYAGVKGKMIRESSKSSRKADAEALLRQRKMEVDDGRNPHKRPIPKISLAEFAPEYLKGKKHTQRSFDRTDRIVNQILSDLGNIPLNNFNYAVVEDWKNERLSINKESTVRRYMAVLKNIFKEARNRRKMSQDAFDQVSRVKMKKPKNERIRYLTVDESNRLIEHCEEHLKPIVIIALDTGMRKGEILQLKWSNVDLIINRINLSADITKDSEIRSIPMTTRVKQTLQKIDRRPHIEYVFWNTATNKPVKDIKRSFATAINRAKITDFTFHDLRHTFASQFMMKGGNIETLRRLLGHASLTMTMRYAHLAPAHIEDAMVQFEEKMTGKRKKEKKVVNL